LPALTKGQVIISGACVNTPVLCKVRKRLTQHGGETLNAPVAWQQHFQQHRVQARKIEQATVSIPRRSQTVRGRSID
jgi:hypothetical protein